MSRNKILVPEAREPLNQLKAKVMKAEGAHADNVKYEIGTV